MKILKKDGLIEDWDNDKIVKAILKASERINFNISKTQALAVAEKCKNKVDSQTPTSKLHSIVIKTLGEMGYSEISDAYQEYRDYKNTYAKSWEHLKKDADAIIFLGDKENANFDSSLVSTKGSLIKGSLTKELYQQFYLSKKEKFLTKRGDIYIHDLRDMIFGSVNCCLFDIENVLKGGFEMSGVKYSEPKTVLSALQLIGDITLVATAQQFGGFTLAEIDKVLLYYVKKSFKLNCNKFSELTTDTQKVIDFSIKETIRELEQGFQSLELKLNTVPCSRGDFAFTTLTFGQWDVNLDNNDKFWLKTIGETLLKVRKNGHNGFMVVFPKLVYLYDSQQIRKDTFSQSLFDEAVKTSSTCMYPDYLSLDGAIEVNKVAQEFRDYGTIISPMGCIDYHERVNILRDKRYQYNIKIGDLFNHFSREDSSNFLETKFDKTLKSKKVLNENKFKENGYITFDGDLVNIWAVNFKESVGRKPCRIDFEEHFGISFPRRNQRNSRGYDISLFNIWDSYLELRVADDLKYSGFTEKMYKEECTSEKDFVRNSKFKVNGKTYEIDIFFPKLNYGIEIQDFATHSRDSDNEISEKGYHKRGISYHNEKRESAKTLGIEIVELWEDKIRANDYSELKIEVKHKDYKVKNTIKTFSNEVSDVLELENFNLEIQDIDGNYTKLKRIIRNKNITDWLNITFENGNKIRVTEDHPFVTENGQILANELNVGDYLLSENEEQILITQIEKDNEVGYSYDVQTESETFVFSGIASHNCRAYLSHYEDENGARTIGRCNIGAVSLNIPVIMAVAKQEFGSDWKSKFWSLLDARLETIREFLKKRYDIIRNTKASTNPLAFTQGGFYQGYLKPDDKIGDLVKYMTASFGITALNESTILWNGKSIYEDKSQFANKVVDFILERIEKFKKIDGYLYALYGTPAESLCMKQAQQYKDLTGDSQFGEYFSNSFHCHVSENITPIEKQDAEFSLFHKVAGGHIQYVRIDNPENLVALKTIIKRGMEMGFYQGVNFERMKCNKCGEESYNTGLKCPHCGSTDTNVIDRVCGYLGYSNLNGQTRMNDGKMCEIRDRVSM